jgi:hypothetical protein
MITTDEQIATFAAGLRARLEDCVSIEGSTCAELDAELLACAVSIREFLTAVKTWRRDIYCARAEFDGAVEVAVLTQGRSLQSRGAAAYAETARAEETCFGLAGRTALGASLFELQTMLQSWTPPQRSVGPGPRNRYVPTAEEVTAFRERMMPAMAPTRGL